MRAPLPSDYERLGFALSFIGHAACVAIIIGGRLWEGSWGRDIPAYSVTIEAGRSLGGRAQVAKEKQTSKVSPSKAAAGQDAPMAVPQKAATAVPRREEPVAPAATEPPQPPVPQSSPVAEPPKPSNEAPTAVPLAEPTIVPTTIATAVPTIMPSPPRTTPPPAVQPTKVAPTKAPPKNVEKDYQSALQKYLGDSSQAGGNGFGAARLGGDGFGGGEQKPPEFFAYLQTVKDAVRQQWRWYDSRSVLVVEVEMQIAKDGVILAQRIVRGSGNDEYDDSVYRAIKAASPLPPPPASVYRDFQLVRVIFDARND